MTTGKGNHFDMFDRKMDRMKCDAGREQREQLEEENMPRDKFSKAEPKVLRSQKTQLLGGWTHFQKKEFLTEVLKITNF